VCRLASRPLLPQHLDFSLQRLGRLAVRGLQLGSCCGL